MRRRSPVGSQNGRSFEIRRGSERFGRPSPPTTSSASWANAQSSVWSSQRPACATSCAVTTSGQRRERRGPLGRSSSAPKLQALSPVTSSMSIPSRSVGSTCCSSSTSSGGRCSWPGSRPTRPEPGSPNKPGTWQRASRTRAEPSGSWPGTVTPSSSGRSTR
jgi:hypothetical protein